MVTVGMEYMGTGGSIVPPSSVMGRGADPALLDNTDSCAEKSCLSEGDNTGNMCSSRKVMCLVEALCAPIFLLVPTNSCSNCTCKAGHPCEGAVDDVRDTE